MTELKGGGVMNLVIQHQGVKRVINGPFAICASRSDFQRLVEQLKRPALDDDFNYGWVDIRTGEDEAVSGPPIGWKEPA